MQRTARLSHGCRLLWLTMGKKIDVYAVEDARPDPSVASPAFRLTKPDGTQYTVHRDRHGIGCTCQDATYRQRMCKHGKALVAVGLIRK